MDYDGFLSLGFNSASTGNVSVNGVLISVSIESSSGGFCPPIAFKKGDEIYGIVTGGYPRRKVRYYKNRDYSNR